MKKLLILASVLLALAAPSAFACTGCNGFACDDGFSAWCIEHFDYCQEGGGCSPAPQAAVTVTPFSASWKVAAVQRLEPKAAPQRVASAPAPQKVASLTR